MKGLAGGNLEAYNLLRYPIFIFCDSRSKKKPSMGRLLPKQFGCYFGAASAGALSPALSDPSEAGALESAGLADWEVIFAKLAFSCSGSAWFGLPQAAIVNATKAAARSGSLII
jgi:hypothetical protein